MLRPLNLNFFTLHVRLTRDCNAHCTYCSSAGASDGRMSPEDFRKSIDFIVDHVLPRTGKPKGGFITVEYLGGEILLVPEHELRENVAYARARLGEYFSTVRDGAQSNLIGAKRRILALAELFEGRVGTSQDPGTGQRQVAGSAALYSKMLEASIKVMEDAYKTSPGRVIVIDKPGAAGAVRAVLDAQEGGYDIVLRPVFQGGSQDIDPMDVEGLVEVMTQCYDAWIKNPCVAVEPFSSLTDRRKNRGGQGQMASSGCPFQSDCTAKSLSLDPDGSLYICQEMADSNNYPLGNAIKGTFDEKTWRYLARRTAHLDNECSRCDWLAECGGGCMNEAVLHHQDPFARTELCPVWKSLFSRIERDLYIQEAHPLKATRTPA